MAEWERTIVLEMFILLLCPCRTVRARHNPHITDITITLFPALSQSTPASIRALLVSHCLLMADNFTNVPAYLLGLLEHWVPLLAYGRKMAVQQLAQHVQ